jgi:hypothetical protein
MKSKIAKGEINPRPLFRKSLFSSFLYYFVLIYIFMIINPKCNLQKG